MLTITLITGNQHKLSEWQRLLPADFKLDHLAIDLPEIQSNDASEIAVEKAKQAYAAAGRPVVVEDVTAGLDELNGLPGPFIKFFEEQLGRDALAKLAHQLPAPAVVLATIVYFDGRTAKLFQGTVKGKVIQKATEGGFGFDCVFIPEGANKTYGEMTANEKDACSHRHLAVEQLIAYLRSLAA